MTKRNVQKQATRQKIINTAQHQFATNGFIATSTLDIAQHAGISHGALFIHFATREELVIEVIQAFGMTVAGRIHDLAKAGQSLRTILNAHLQGIGEHETLYARLIDEGPVLPVAARQALIGIQSAISFHIYAAATRDMHAGRIKIMPMHLFFNTWIGLLHHYLANRDLFAPGASVIKTCGPDLLNHFCNLVQLKTGDKI